MIKMSFLSTETGYSRQWLSKAAEQGKIPGAFRRSSGRWSLPDSPDLQKWIDQMRQATSGWRARRAYRVEYAIQALRDKRENTWKRFGNDLAFKGKMSALGGQIKEAEKHLSNYLSSSDIAKETGRSKRWVTNIADKIPGVAVYKNRWVFYKSDKLGHWLEREHNAVLAEKRRMRVRSPLANSQVHLLFSQTRRFRFLLDRILRQMPLEYWPIKIRDQIVSEFDELSVLLVGHVKPWSTLRKR